MRVNIPHPLGADRAWWLSRSSKPSGGNPAVGAVGSTPSRSRQDIHKERWGEFSPHLSIPGSLTSRQQPPQWRWTLSLGEQDAQHIRSGFRRKSSQLLHSQAAERVGDNHVWIVGNTAQVRHCVCAGDERLSANHRRGNAAPLEGKSVVHTAR